MKESILSLLKTHKKWISEDELDRVVSRIHYIYLEDPKSLDGDILGLFAKRLIDSEIEIGGPYISKEDIYTNTLIRNLFRAMGTPLEKLETYLVGKIYLPKNKEQKLSLNLSTNNPKLELKKTKIINNPSVMMSKNAFKNFDRDIRKQALFFLEKIIKLDTKSEISLISNYIQESLLNRYTLKDPKISYTLGSANTYAWIAYTIYDDFIDGEGSPMKLSLANIMHRKSYSEYVRLFPFQNELINQHFDSVDISNLWELKHCRVKISDNTILINKIPSYGNGEFLANRSVGHVLGPKLLINNYKITTKQNQLINSAFDDYLIAKQINDDLTDWKSDIRNGHLSYVVSMLLRNKKIKNGEYNIETLIDDLKIIFWNNVYEKCLNEVINRIYSSQKKIKSSELFLEDNVFLSKVILPIKDEAEYNLKKHMSEKEFLKIFNT